MKPFCFNGAKVGIIFELCNFSAIIFSVFLKIAPKQLENGPITARKQHHKQPITRARSRRNNSQIAIKIHSGKPAGALSVPISIVISIYERLPEM